MKVSILLKYKVINSLLTLALCVLLLASCGLNAVYTSTAQTAPTEITLNCLPQDCLTQALAFKQNNQPEQADAVLRAIRATYPATEWSVRASYLLGLSAIEDKNARQAILLFIDAVKLTAIEDRVLFNLAQAYAADGQHALAATLFSAVNIMHPDSVLTESAGYRRAEALFNSGDYAQARAAYDDFTKAYSKNALVKDALIASGRASILLGDPVAAILPLHKLHIRHPVYRSSAQTAADVDALITALNATGNFLPQLTQDERLMRADALFAAQRWEDAAAAYKEINSPQLRSKAILRSAEAMQRLKRYAKSEEILRNYLSGSGDPTNKPRALRLLVTSLIRQDKADELKRLINEHKLLNRQPDAELAETQLAAGRYFDDRGDNKTALSLYAILLASSGNTNAGQEAAWLIGWRNYREGRYKEAVKGFSTGCAQDSGRCLYWSGRASEKAGLKEAAAEYYHKACSDTSYYCMLASKRLPSASAAPVVSPLLALVVNDNNDRELITLSGDSHYLAATELGLLGQPKQAAEELDRITKRYSNDNDAALALSNLFYKNGDIYRGLRTWRLYLSQALSARPYAASMAYPSQAIDLARDCSDARDTDPYLVASIMREESAFNPEAVSRAGAMGMMQLMPATARFIAERTTAPRFATQELLTSHTNIRLGSRYLNYLLGLFDGNVIHAVAAYNAGPAAVRAWTEKYPNEADEFIESIPYPETKEYTKRVIFTYNQYLRLSDAAPKNVSSLTGLGGKPVATVLNYRSQ